MLKLVGIPDPDQRVDELNNITKSNGWQLVGFDLDAVRQSGDGRTPAPMFIRA
jgi:hypothetical protein